MNKKINTFYFIPSIESHYYNFVPLCKQDIDKNINTSLLIIKDIFPENRNIQNITPLNNQKFYSSTDEAVSFLNEEFSNSSKIVVVGNDSEKRITPLLHKLKDIGYYIVLMQDGWLSHKSILNPVYKKKNFIRKRIHRILVLKSSFFKKHYSNLIGQNSDYFFVYSDIAKQNFIKAGIKEDRIFITGSPRFDELSFDIKDGKKAIVLFLTTYNESKSNYISEIISKVRGSLKKSFVDDYVFIIKPHPSDNNNYVNFINNESIIFKNDIISLFKEYNVIFAFCFNSTVIFELMSKKIPFLQLFIHPFSKNVNYQLDLPYVSDLNELNRCIELSKKFNYTQAGSKYLKNLDADFDSVKTTLFCLKELSYKQS